MENWANNSFLVFASAFRDFVVGSFSAAPADLVIFIRENWDLETGHFVKVKSFIVLSSSGQLILMLQEEVNRTEPSLLVGVHTEGEWSV